MKWSIGKLCLILILLAAFCTACVPGGDMAPAADVKLLQALRNDNLAALQEAISEGAQLDKLGVSETVNDRNKESSPLHIASFLGRESLALELLEAGADSNGLSCEGIPILHAAFARGQLSLCAALLEAGADTGEAEQGTPLDACFSLSPDNAECVSLMTQGYRLLQQHNFNVTEEAAERCLELLADRSAYGLIQAVILDAGGCGDSLLLALATGDAVTPGACEPIHMFCAAAFGTPEALAALIGDASPADMRDAQGKTLLTVAAEAGNCETLSWLLPVFDETARATALLGAATQGQTEAALLLLDAGITGADVELLLEEASRSGSTGLVQRLLPECENYADAVMAAVEAGQAEALRLLLQAGADPDAGYSNVLSAPLIEAARRGNTNCMQLLLEYGADINIEVSGQTPLSAACRARAAEAVALLIRCGADVDYNCTAAPEFAPLVQAAYAGSLDCVELLLQAGATVTEDMYAFIAAVPSTTIAERISAAEEESAAAH